MVVRKPVPPPVAPPLSPASAAAAQPSLSGNLLPSDRPGEEGGGSEQYEIGFDWDTCETSDDPEASSAQIPPPASPPKASTNPFRRRMMSRGSDSNVPDLMTFEPDGSDAPPTSPSTNPLKPLPSPNSPTSDPIGSPARPAEQHVTSAPKSPPPVALDGNAHIPGPPKQESAMPAVAPSNLDQVPQIHISTPPPAHQSQQTHLEAAQAKIKQQRNEVYQIKHIRWYDATSPQNPRQSPILIQNANGPCPLLALVNALVLSTPPITRTTLLDTLSTREQISLGLLIDAVFDELTSDRRRARMAVDLPDVTELYSFLITLHTGMNVNPRFVPPAVIDHALPGAFEETREMKLYGTFSIPLIHGWLPHKNEKAYQAFERTAQTYEDAQNVQFREEELQAKLASEEISPEEQQLLQDVTTMNQFFVYWPTQLTAHGLDVMLKFLQPGQMAILFRNDHFSTVYKEPRSLRLMTLVTDAGYATHDEIVWESLVDISGAESEFCSGDFRSVSHNQQPGLSSQAESASPAQTAGEWTTVQSKNQRARRGRPSAVADPVVSPPTPPEKIKLQHPPPARFEALDPAASSSSPQRTASEQEDHDLALALQLQEEEEERQRNEAAARRAHENDLSEQYLAREAPFQGRESGEGPRIPVRRSGLRNPNATNNATPSATSNTTNRNDTGGDAGEPPPPSYEEAAADLPFHPPSTHPSSEHAPRARSTAQSQPTSAYRTAQEQPMRASAPGQRRMSARQSLMEQQNYASPMPLYQGPVPRRATGVSNSDKDGDKCLVM